MQWKLFTQWSYTWVSNSINETKIKTLRNSHEYKITYGGSGEGLALFVLLLRNFLLCRKKITYTQKRFQALHWH